MQNNGADGIGPVAQVCACDTYGETILLSNYHTKENASFVKWLQQRSASKIEVHQINLTSPTNYEEIYRAAISVIESTIERLGKNIKFTFNLSPGTSAMAAVWLLLSKTKYRATLVESSKDHGVKKVEIPFAISVDFLPHLYEQTERNLKRLAAGVPIDAPEFKDIIHSSQIMQQAILRAQRVAIHSLPVLIEGESGTGKELFARAIHKTSNRKGKFISINCGAIPKELVESELFGHEKGSFTGATEKRTGHFEAAHGGTIFLDEVGELPKDIQVKMLRTIQEHEVKPVGATTSKTVDLRIIAATNRTLIDDVGDGSFREDLFYRLAVAVIKLPPLRKRSEDIRLITEYFLDQINKDSKNVPGYKQKTISIEGRNILENHPWPGNVRELQNTLTRAMVWSEGETIDKEDIREALLPMPVSSHKVNGIMERSLDEGFDIRELIEEVRGHYYKRALIKSNNNRSKAAKLLGLPNYQTLTTWLMKNSCGTMQKEPGYKNSTRC